MFLEELESEIVLAKRILASWSFAKDPIGWKGIQGIQTTGQTVLQYTTNPYCLCIYVD